MVCPANEYFTVGATTVSAIGGNGGAGDAAYGALTVHLGGPGNLPTGGDVNAKGSPGGYAVILSTSANASGHGGASYFAGGGRGLSGTSNGIAGTQGAGGSGAVTTITTGYTGGVGGTGLIIVYEYS